MMSWVTASWSDVCTLNYGKALKNYKHFDSPYPVYGSGGIVGSTDTPIAPAKRPIVARKGTLTVYWSEDASHIIDTAYWLEPKESLDPHWAYFAVKNLDISNLASGTGVPSLSRDDFYREEVALPPLSDQKAIAHVLGTLDDKIELNQKMNQTLEEIAKAIFKSWFVDFDPVRAKAEGRPTGLPPEISDLFPDELVDSEIGEIPKGWEVSPLSEFIVEVGKKTKPSPETEERPYVPIDCISSQSLTLWEFKNGEEAKSSLVSFKKGDILFGAMRPYFHKVCLAPFDGTTRTTCLVLSSKERDYFGFSLLTLFLDSTIDFATQNSTGSTIPYIKWKNELETLTVPLPPIELAGKFNKLFEPILEKFAISIEEQKVLSELRDTLLPKLISGELRIPDAEKFLEEAGI